MSEEKKQILKMIEEGKITAEEGLELLNALNGEDTGSTYTTTGVEKAKWLKVRVFEKNGKSKVNVNIPVALIDIALKLGSKFHSDLDKYLEGIDLNEIIDAAKNGVEGKLVEVEEESGDKVEVFIE